MGLIFQKYIYINGNILTQKNRDMTIKDLEKMFRQKYTEELRRYLWKNWQNDLIPIYFINNLDLTVLAGYRLLNESKITEYCLIAEEKKCRM